MKKEKAVDHKHTSIACDLRQSGYKRNDLSFDRSFRKLFTGLESDRFARRDWYLGTRSRVSANSALSRLYDKYAEAPEFNAISLCERLLHSIKKRIDNLFGLLLGNASLIGNVVDDIEFDHWFLLVNKMNVRNDPFLPV
jgi:hypothetical protein